MKYLKSRRSTRTTNNNVCLPDLSTSSSIRKLHEQENGQKGRSTEHSPKWFQAASTEVVDFHLRTLLEENARQNKIPQLFSTGSKVQKKKTGSKKQYRLDTAEKRRTCYVMVKRMRSKHASFGNAAQKVQQNLPASFVYILPSNIQISITYSVWKNC